MPTLLAQGEDREVWVDEIGLDGGSEALIITSIQPTSVDLTGVCAWLFVDGAVGTPNPRIALDVNNGFLVAWVRNAAEVGNVMLYTLDVWYRGPGQPGIQAVVTRRPYEAS